MPGKARPKSATSVLVDKSKCSSKAVVFSLQRNEKHLHPTVSKQKCLCLSTDCWIVPCFPTLTTIAHSMIPMLHSFISQLKFVRCIGKPLLVTNQNSCTRPLT